MEGCVAGGGEEGKNKSKEVVDRTMARGEINKVQKGRVHIQEDWQGGGGVRSEMAGCVAGHGEEQRGARGGRGREGEKGKQWNIPSRPFQFSGSCIKRLAATVDAANDITATVPRAGGARAGHSSRRAGKRAGVYHLSLGGLCRQTGGRAAERVGV